MFSFAHNPLALLPPHLPESERAIGEGQGEAEGRCFLELSHYCQAAPQVHLVNTAPGTGPGKQQAFGKLIEIQYMNGLNLYLPQRDKAYFTF